MLYRFQQNSKQLSSPTSRDGQRVHRRKSKSKTKNKYGRILSHAPTWMNPEGVMLVEISQSQQDKYYMIPLIGGTWSSQIQRQKIEWGCRERGSGCSLGTDLQNEKFSGSFPPHVNIPNTWAQPVPTGTFNNG